MNALSRMIDAVRPGGLILDLQVIRPDPRVELDGRVVAELDGERLFRWADAATAAIDARVRDGDLVDEAVDDHDVCKHYANGAELVEDVAGSKRRLPGALVPRIAAIEEPLLTRERCRLRRLRVGGLARPREPDRRTHPSPAGPGRTTAVSETERRRGNRWLGPRMRAVPSIVTPIAAVAVALLLSVWWSDGTWRALSLATGYTAAGLLLATLLVTPVTVLRRRRPAPVHLPLRRSLGVHAGLLALLHMLLSFPVHLGGDVVRFFLVPGGGPLVDRFGLSNWAGLVANVLFVVLLFTSTDGWLRRLGSPAWKRLHRVVFPAAALTLLHTLGYQSLRHASVGVVALTLGAVGGLLVVRLRGRAAASPRS